MKKLINLWTHTALEEKILWVYTMLIPFTGVLYFHLGMKRVGFCDFVFFGLFVVWSIKYLIGKKKFKKTSLEFAFIFMFGLFSLSFINSVNLFASFVELAALIYLAALFILILNIISTPQRLRYLLNIYLFVSLVISLIGLYYFCLALSMDNAINSRFLFYNTIESMAHHFPRIQVTLETPNMMLSYLHAALIAGIILFLLEKRPKIRTLIFLSIAIILTVAFFTGSRRFTGLLLSLFIILCLFGKSKIISVVKYASFLGFIFFLVISVITSIWVVFPVELRTDKRNINLKANYAYSLHFIQPVASINMLKKHPFIGVGFGTYNRHFKENVDWEWLRSAFGFEAYPEYTKSVENKTLSFDPHSVFLGTLAETGLVGFFGLICFFSMYMMLLIKRFRKSDKYSLQKIVSGCILAGFIGFLLNGLTMDILSMRHFWIMMAIGIAANGE